MLTADLIASCRAQFPALKRQVDGQSAVYFDGPAGTQVPDCVVDAVTSYLADTNANHGGQFATSRESDDLLAAAHRASADFLGTNDPGCVAFGPNMTSLTFSLSRALARTWSLGDEILLTNSEHDANFTPWVLAAADVGAKVVVADIRREDCTLDVEDLRAKLTPRTRLVAVGCASNATGSVNPVREICRWAREVGALSFLDAVHYAPHALIDVEELGCDFLACSAYKFFGPHVGLLWGRRDWLEALQPYKLRPATDSLPGKWMTGTQNHEGIAGVMAAIEYLEQLGYQVVDNAVGRRQALKAAFEAISEYERKLVTRLLDGLATLGRVRVWGITDPARTCERLPTVSITHDEIHPSELASRLGERGIFVWHGNYYALPLTEALGLEPDGMVRIGMVHYNTEAEVDRLLGEMRRL